MPAAETDAGPICTTCGYSLRGLGSLGRCPECGDPFWLSIPEPPPGSHRTFLKIRAAIVAAILGRLPSFWTVAVTLLILCTAAIVIWIASAAYQRIAAEGGGTLSLGP